MIRVIVQARLDGSYAPTSVTGGARFLAYAGVFGYEDAWKTFAPLWRQVLSVHDIDAFRTTELRGMSGFDDLRASLVEILTRCGLQAVGTAADVTLLSARNEARRKRDLFEDVVRQLLRAAPSEVGLALVCDREQDLAKEVASWLERLQWIERQKDQEDTYDRIAGICYMNSRVSLQVQAADLTAALFREHAEREQRNPGSQIDPLLGALTGGRMVNSRIERSEFLT